MYKVLENGQVLKKTNIDSTVIWEHDGMIYDTKEELKGDILTIKHVKFNTNTMKWEVDKNNTSPIKGITPVDGRVTFNTKIQSLDNEIAHLEEALNEARQEKNKLNSLVIIEK